MPEDQEISEDVRGFFTDPEERLWYQSVTGSPYDIGVSLQSEGLGRPVDGRDPWLYYLRFWASKRDLDRGGLARKVTFELGGFQIGEDLETGGRTYLEMIDLASKASGFLGLPLGSIEERDFLAEVLKITEKIRGEFCGKDGKLHPEVLAYLP